jgi:L-ribulose-5-phosphate 3-epimerase
VDSVKLGGAGSADALDRRQVLALAAATALPRALRAKPRGRKLRKSLMFGMVEGPGTLLEKFTMLRDVGFEGVELDSPSDRNPDEVLAAMGKTGIEVAGVVDSAHWKDTLGDPDAAVRARGVAALETALRDAKRFRATSVLLVPAVVNARIAYDEAWTRSQAEIRKVLPLAAELQVAISIENVWNQFLLSPLEAARYVDEFQNPWVGWHLDLGNAVNYGWPEQWIRILGKRIQRLHIKDYSRKKRDDEGLWKGFDVELGKGDVDWKASMAALDAIGYTGWASAEVAGGDSNRLRTVAAQMDSLFAA